MERTFRTLAFAALLALGQQAFAQQPFTVIMTGTVLGCSGNSFVNVASLPGTTPAIDIDVPVLPPSCTFTIALNVAVQNGGFTVSVPCQGAVQQQVVQFQMAPVEDSTAVSVLFNCGASVDCLGIPGGSATSGTPCTTVNSEPGVFDSNCDCIPFASACTACFTVSQDTSGTFTPFEADLNSCSSSVGGSYTLSWEMPDGSGPTGESTTYTFPGPGTYEVCLWMAGNDNNCTSTFCDSVVVDTNGTITFGPGIQYDCLQIPNGPNLPGSACIDLNTGEEGVWSADCMCITEGNPIGCQAGYWVIQAYEGDSLNGEVTPIPNEVWVWNLSSGTSPFQFLWSFGDGTSSTEAYPTHVYATGGPYTLCLTMTDASGCTSTYCDEVSIDENGIYNGMVIDGRPGWLRNGFTIRVREQLSTGVQEDEVLNELRTWPNPVNDRLNLSFRSTLRGTMQLQIVDVNGRVLRTTNATFATGDDRIELSTAELPAGLYLLRMEQAGHAQSIRFVKD